MNKKKLGWVQELFVIEISPSYGGENTICIKEPGTSEKILSRGYGSDQPFKLSRSRGNKTPEIIYCSPSKINEIVGSPLEGILDNKSRCKCKTGGDPIFVDHQDSGFKEIRCSKCGGNINTRGSGDE